MKYLLLLCAVPFCFCCGHTDAAQAKGLAGGYDGPDAPALIRELGVDWVRYPVSMEQMNGHMAEVTARLDAFEREIPGVRIMLLVRVSNDKPSHMPGLWQYRRFMRSLAKTCRGRVWAYQIENEVDSSTWWAGSTRQYVSLLKEARRAIRRYDSGALIVMAGFTSESLTVATYYDEGWTPEQIAELLGGEATPEAVSRARERDARMRAILRDGSRYADLVDAHLYHQSWTIPARIEWLQRAAGKPVIVAEAGGPDIVVSPWSESQQAVDVAERMELAYAAGAVDFAWLSLYELDNEYPRFRLMGLVAQDGRRKPAFDAYKLQ